jgi:8-oxo-dGTP pyrophosphatase MutT (NUDIX family)
VHAKGMHADVRGIRRSGSKAVPSGAGNCHGSPEFVSLANLRELSHSEQVAAVCYRVRSSGIEFLLVRTRGGGRWTFPKGSAEPGLTPAQAAAMEAFEEAGVHGRIEQNSFARYAAQKRAKSKRGSFAKEIVVKAHLCQVLRLARPKEPDRDRTWFSAEEAARHLRKGRDSSTAAAFARVIQKAILCIEGLQKENESRNNHKRGHAVLTSLSRQSLEKDALQKVLLEAQPYGWGVQVPLLPKGVRKLDAMQSYSSFNENQPRKLLQ